jgi:hypothetical protein
MQAVHVPAPNRHNAAITSDNHDDVHAGELETSIPLGGHPAYLRDGWQASDHTASDRRYLTTLGMRAYNHQRGHREFIARLCRRRGAEF